MIDNPYATTSPFMRCLPHVLREEVVWKDPFVWSDVAHNFSDDKKDPGGKTMCGIIQREYDHYRKAHGLFTRPVQLISESEGYWVYYNWYWLPHAGILAPGLDLSFFDSAVNEGSTEAIRILQVALGVENDGMWGPKTAEAAKLTPVASAIQRFLNRRCEVYEESKNFDSFGKDWLARTHRIEAASMAMVA